MVFIINIWSCFENAEVLEVVSTHNNQICNSNLEIFFYKNTKQHKIQLILTKLIFFNPNPKMELKEASALLL